MGCGPSTDVFDAIAEPRTKSYHKNHNGIYESFWEFRTALETYKPTPRPKLQEKEIWTDPKSPDLEGCQSFRPQNIGQEYHLYCKDPEFPDINPGELDTGYILAVIAKIVRQPTVIKHILSESCYLTSFLLYDGVVHSKFWRFGRWEDVYTDDRIPVRNTSRVLSYCHDKSELWLTFLEKAWSKFWGGYNNIEYGTFYDAHLHLTGGVQDIIYLDKTKLKPGEIYYRIKHGLENGAMVACAVSGKHDGVYGLTAGDTIIILGTYQVHTQKRQELHLLHMYDPLNFTDWKGPWRKKAAEWDKLTSHNNLANEIEDSEFIMAFRDFTAYMEYVCVCSITPLKSTIESKSVHQYCTHIYGEWKGDTAAGNIKILDNPKFLFSLQHKGSARGERVPLGISLVQRTRTRTSDRAPIYLRLFKTRQQKQGLLIEEIGESVEQSNQQVVRSVTVPPGNYIVIANTAQPEVEKEFLIRLYTLSAISDVRLLGSDEPLLLLKEDKPLNLKDMKCNFLVCEEIWGRWTKGFHGGFIYDGDFHKNPQLDITVPVAEELKQMIRFKVLKDWNADDACLGFRLFRVDLDDVVPKTEQWFNDNWDNSVRCRDGSIEGWEWDYLAPTFFAEPGRYCGILYNEKKGGSDTAFCIMIQSETPLQIKGHNLGK